jgi:hypothetical protein
VGYSPWAYSYKNSQRLRSQDGAGFNFRAESRQLLRKSDEGPGLDLNLGDDQGKEAEADEESRAGAGGGTPQRTSLKNA